MGDEHLTPELAAVVEHTRKRLAERGEWPRPKPIRPFQSSITPEDAKLIHAWLWEGGYDEAIAQISAEHPELGNQ